MPRARGKRYTTRQEPYRLRNRKIIIERDGNAPPRVQRQSTHRVITPGTTLPKRTPRGPSQRNRPSVTDFGFPDQAPAEGEDREEILENETPVDEDAAVPDSDDPAGNGTVGASAPSPPEPSFFRFPGELRNMIYERLFDPNQHNNSLAPLLTSRQFRTEALNQIGLGNRQPGSTQTDEDIGLTTVWNRTWFTLRHRDWNYNLPAVRPRERRLWQTLSPVRRIGVHRVRVRGPGPALDALHHFHTTWRPATGLPVNPIEYRVVLTTSHLLQRHLHHRLERMLDDFGNHTRLGRFRSVTFTLTTRDAWRFFCFLPLAWIAERSDWTMAHHYIDWPDNPEQGQTEYLENYRLHARFVATAAGVAAGYHDFDVYFERPPIRWRSNDANDPVRHDYVDEYSDWIQSYLDNDFANGGMDYNFFPFSDAEEADSEEDENDEQDQQSGQDGQDGQNNAASSSSSVYDEDERDEDSEYSNEDRDDWEGWVPRRPAEDENDEANESGEATEDGEIDEGSGTEDGEIADDGEGDEDDDDRVDGGNIPAAA